MSRRRRRVKIKSSSQLFAFILFNLLLLASCITAHYQEQQPQHEFEVLPPAASPYHLLVTPTAPAAVSKFPHGAEQNFDLPALLSGGIGPSKFSAPAQSQRPSSLAPTPTTGHINNNNNLNLNHQSSQQQAYEPAVADVAHSYFQYSPAQAQTQTQQQHHAAAQIRYRENHAAQQQQQQQQVAVPSIQSLCSMVPVASARQLKLCKLTGHSPQADEAVAAGAARGLAECRHQFRSERWNCTHAAGEHHLLTSRFAQSLGNRESAFVQAIAAAGIVHSIATACSVGSLSDCACDKSRVGLIRQKDQIWKWGGCSNNIRHGMMFARHLVELLDAVHEQHHHQQQHHQMQRSLHQNQHKSHHNRHSHNHHHHQLEKRQIHGSDTPSAGSSKPQAQMVAAASQFCQKNHQNISQTTHLQLIKSLLAKNSLERHQDFRLAMNMHNNKVGRMAVARNMEIKCRCHGLSGSCSLKTCWLKLPDFQQVGAYLRRKYESSVHLPSAVNVNRLIPMMDRNEMSAILQLQQQQQQQQQGHAVSAQSESAAGAQHAAAAAATGRASAASGAVDAQSASGNSGGLENSLAAAVSSASASSGGQPEFAALTRPLNDEPAAASGASESPPPPPAGHFNYYERHRQLEQRQQVRLATAQVATKSASSMGNSSTGTTSLYLHGEEEPVQVAPMSQPQYQALLREMRLCGAGGLWQSSVANSSISHQVSTRDLHNMESSSGGLARGAKRRPASGTGQAATGSQQTSNSIHHQEQIRPINHQQVVATPPQPAQQQLKLASQHLSQLLQVGAARDDLVHLHRSPDYCEPEPRHGFAGVSARVCSADDPKAPDSCDRLCCGRGFERRETQFKKNCDCKFQYCCKIHCNLCEERRVEFVCK